MRRRPAMPHFSSDQVELSPDAAKKFCPWAAIFLKVRVQRAGSAGVQPQEQPIVVGSGLCVVIALMIAVSVEPMYIVRLESPGAMPRACVISRVLLGVIAVATGACVNAAGAGAVDRKQVMGTLLV